MTMTMLTTELRASGPSVEVHLSGDLDLGSVPTLLACIEGLDPGVRQIVLDLSTLTFLDSSGISAIVLLHQRFEPELRDLVLRGAQGQVRSVLQMSGVGDILQIVA
jgi:anti-anti-sigma factor